MSTRLNSYQTTGIVAGGLVLIGACVVSGFALGRRYCCCTSVVTPPPREERQSSGPYGHISAMQMARELAYQKAINELEDYFDHESQSPKDGEFVRKTLSFLEATLAAIH